MGQSGRSLTKADSNGRKSTILAKVDDPSQSEQSFVGKWTVSGRKSVRFKSLKVDGPKISSWTVHEYENGRSKKLIFQPKESPHEHP